MSAKNDAQKEKSGRRRRTNQNTGGAPASWTMVDGEQLAYTIAAVAQKGGALRLGYTRDGGAYAIGIYGDGDPYTEYVSPKEDMGEYLRQLSADFGNVTGDGSFVGTGGK